MAYRLNPIVARTSPNLYAAAKAANIPIGQGSQLEQFSWTVDKNKKLNQLSIDDARKEFNGLDPSAQEKLKYLFPQSDYQLPEPGASNYLTGAVKTGFSVLKSPLILLFKAAGVFNRVLNTPYLLARQASQGEGLFTSESFSDAWDGRRVYDQGALTEAMDYFGVERVEIAKGLIAGKKPGEIIASSGGTVNQKLLDALEESYNNPEEFEKVMDGVKYAQVSPGRDIARSMNFQGKLKTVTSASIDFIYQIAIDPLTWMTGGATAAVRAGVFGLKNQTGTQMRKTIENFGIAGVRDIFRDNKDVVKLWDDQLGPAVKKLIDEPDSIAKIGIRNDIRRRFPGYNNAEAVEFLEKNNVINAARAETVFTNLDNLSMFMAGRVSGAQFFRNGIATARNQRRLTVGAQKALSDFLNPRSGTTKEISKSVDEISKALIKRGSVGEPNLAIPEILDFTKHSRKTLKQRVSLLGARTPQNQEIKLNILDREQSIKSADVFRDTARQVLPKDLAEALTVKFINSDANDQVAMLRSLDVAIMQRLGIEGTPKGALYIKNTLDTKYGSSFGTAVIEELGVPIGFENVVSKSGLKIKDNIPKFDSQDIIHPFQERGAISTLDYQQLARYAYEANKDKLIGGMFGMATQSAMSTAIVNFWSVFTLFPRLGIRSSIDEGFIYYLTAPARDLFQYIDRKGHRMGRIASAYSGSKSGEQLRVKIARALGRKTPADMYDKDVRLKIIKDYAAQNKKLPDELTSFEQKFAQAEYITQALNRGKDKNGKFITGPLSRAEKLSGKLNDEEVQFLIEALTLNSQYLTAGTRSIAAGASIVSRQSTEVTEGIVDLSNFDVAKELFPDIVQGRTGARVDTDRLDSVNALAGRGISLVHFENFVFRFYGNTRNNIGIGENFYFNPVAAFLDSKGLRTERDYVGAKVSLLEQVGLRKNTDLITKFDEDVIPTLGIKITHSVKDPEALKSFLGMTAHTSSLRLRGLDDMEIAEVLVDRILLDMRQTFHGGADGFNEALFNKLKSAYDNLVKQEKESGITIGSKAQKAAQSITFEEFEKLTKGFQPKGQLFTTLQIPGISDMLVGYQKLGSNMMEIMDNQVTGILRQPVVMIKYLDVRRKYAQAEKQMVSKLYLDKLNQYSDEGKFIGEKVKTKIRQDVEQHAKKIITEISVQQAADDVLKFVDNPNVRTNFAVSVRNTGRYYRATEDFWRRVYRLKDVAPRVLYRMRLAHLGLSAAGGVYKDNNNEPYVIMPTDNVIFNVVDKTVRAFGPGEESFKQPKFNEFTFKLTLANPSFSPDAGLPTLSGPIGALSIITMKALLGKVPATKELSEELDNYALGEVGDGMTVIRALVPSSLQKLYSIYPKDETDRQEATAAMQAIAYNQAFNTDEEMAKYLSPTASAEDKYNYLKQIRISAHNVVVMRSLIGLFSPIAPSVQESINVPDYLKEVGITGLRPEFYDLVNAVTKKYKGDIQDPYELAVATFVGKNPGKLIYTVSRNEKQTNVIIQKTKAVKSWAIQNENNLKKYGEAAWIVAPHMGDFDAPTYAYLEAAGLLENKSLDKYYLDVLVAKDKQAYYDIGKEEKEFLKSTPSITARRAKIAQSTRQRALLKASNPLLEAALVAGGNEVASELNMLTNLEEIIKDSSIEMPIGTRQRLAMVASRVRQFVSLANDASIREADNFADIKRDFRTEVENLIADLSSGDAILTEANRAIFKSILGYYSRDTYTAKTYKGY
jgi:hypothetical protein